MMWFILLAAILIEVGATLALRASQGFRKKLWFAPVVIGYAVCALGTEGERLTTTLAALLDGAGAGLLSVRVSPTAPHDIDQVTLLEDIAHDSALVPRAVVVLSRAALGGDRRLPTRRPGTDGDRA